MYLQKQWNNHEWSDDEELHVIGQEPWPAHTLQTHDWQELVHDWQVWRQDNISQENTFKHHWQEESILKITLSNLIEDTSVTFNKKKTYEEL